MIHLFLPSFLSVFVTPALLSFPCSFGNSCLFCKLYRDQVVVFTYSLLRLVLRFCCVVNFSFVLCQQYIPISTFFPQVLEFPLTSCFPSFLQLGILFSLKLDSDLFFMPIL
jgi:hypothetical protein